MGEGPQGPKPASRVWVGSGGWLYMHSLGRHSGPRAYLDDQFTYARVAVRSTVLRSALVKMRTYYAAVELLRPGQEREVFAVVCLVHYNPRDREGQVFGYKDMDESMGRTRPIARPRSSTCSPRRRTSMRSPGARCVTPPRPGARRNRGSATAGSSSSRSRSPSGTAPRTSGSKW